MNFKIINDYQKIVWDLFLFGRCNKVIELFELFSLEMSSLEINLIEFFDIFFPLSKLFFPAQDDLTCRKQLAVTYFDIYALSFELAIAPLSQLYLLFFQLLENFNYFQEIIDFFLPLEFLSFLYGGRYHYCFLFIHVNLSFINRFGFPIRIYCCNGGNFVFVLFIVFKFKSNFLDYLIDKFNGTPIDILHVCPHLSQLWDDKKSCL